MFKITCECGLRMVINCTPKEAEDYKCARCQLPIGRPITDEDRQALAVREFWKEEERKGA